MGNRVVVQLRFQQLNVVLIQVVSGDSQSHTLAGSPHRAVKRLKFEHRPGQVAFISDSMLKFLVENRTAEIND